MQRGAWSGVETGHSVAIQILVEGRLERLDRRAVGVDLGDISAIAVGRPNRVGSGGVLPRNRVSACRLHRADRCPGAVLALRDSSATSFKLRSRAAVIQKIVRPN